MYMTGEGRPPGSYFAGEGEGWQVVGPPHKRRHLLYDESRRSSSSSLVADETAGEVLDRVRKALFHSVAFAKYLKR